MRTEKASLVLDTVPPEIVVVSPFDGRLIQNPNFEIRVKYWDEGSGILLESFQIFLDNVDITAYFLKNGEEAFF